MDKAVKEFWVYIRLISQTKIWEIQIEGKEKQEGIQVAYWWNRLKASMMLLVTSWHLVLWAELLLMYPRIVPQQSQICFVYLKCLISS